MKKFGSLFLSLFAAGLLSAQTPAQPSTQTTTQPTTPMKNHHRVPGGAMMQRLSKRLNLTADQQQQAKAIFQQARQQRMALAPKLKDEHQAMSAAVKSDNEQQIDQILQNNASLNAQARAIHAKAMAKFYQILTPEQKAQFDQGFAKHAPSARNRTHRNA